MTKLTTSLSIYLNLFTRSKLVLPKKGEHDASDRAATRTSVQNEENEDDEINDEDRGVLANLLMY